MTHLEKMITFRKSIRSLYIQNSMCKAIIEGLEQSVIGDSEDYFNQNEIMSYEETMKLFDEIIMRE